MGRKSSSWKIQKVTDENKLENRYMNSTKSNEPKSFG